jgi:hypothetical protein
MTEEIAARTDTQLGLNLGWGTAAELLKPFGTVAANFTEATRVLASAHTASTPLSPGGANHILRLLKNDTIKATYYFLVKQFKPSFLTSKRQIRPQDFLNAFAPIDHAAVITLCYLFKNFGRMVDEEEWDYVQSPLYEAATVGGQIGLCVSQVGFGLGLLTRSLRYLAFAPLIRENRKAFKEYRQYLKTKDIPFDATFEQKAWQCTTSQISGLLLEQMGFPRTAALQFVAAAERSQSAERRKATEPDARFGVPFRLAECLMDAYMEGNEIPTAAPSWVGQEIALPAEVRGKLLAALNNAHDDNKRIEWLNKSSSDLTPRETPKLFTEAE